MPLIDPPRLSAPTHLASPRWVAVVNLLNSIVGAGILSLPFAFRECGYVSGVAMQLAFGLITFYGIWLLLTSLEFAPGVRSSEDLADRAIGRPGWYLYNVSTAVNCTGACLGYVIVIGDILVSLLAELGAPTPRAVLLVGVTTFVIFPLSAQRDFSALQYASAAATCIYLAFAVVMVVLVLDGPDAPLQPPPAPFKPDVGGLIRAVPLSAFSFQCITHAALELDPWTSRSTPCSPRPKSAAHTLALHNRDRSLFPIYQELRDPTPARMGAVAAVALGVAALVYAAVGASAYGYFGEGLRGDVLLNLATIDSDGLRLLRAAFGLSICFSMPLWSPILDWQTNLLPPNLLLTWSRLMPPAQPTQRCTTRRAARSTSSASAPRVCHLEAQSSHNEPIRSTDCHYAAHALALHAGSEGDTPHTRLLLWTAAIVGSTLLVGLSLGTVKTALLAAPWLATTGSPGCIRRFEAALRTREKRVVTSDPTERPCFWSSSRLRPGQPIPPRLTIQVARARRGRARLDGRPRLHLAPLRAARRHRQQSAPAAAAEGRRLSGVRRRPRRALARAGGHRHVRVK